MSLRRNVIANYLGQGWRALIGLAFLPLYVRYLGIESYGLIGIYAMLQAWLAIFDMGMKPALSREMARFTAGAHDAQSIRDLLRSVEILAIALAAAIGLMIWLSADWLATRWLNAQHLSTEIIRHAITIMGAIAALRFIEDIYVSSIVGLQRQVIENSISSIAATVRAVGAILILRWVSPTIEAFFLWQGVVSVISIAAFSYTVYRVLPPAPQSARFSKAALTSVWRFASGVMVITFLALLLTQIDKIVLSRLLTLENFSYYALAGTLAGVLAMLTAPIAAALYPRFTELAARNDESKLSILYHQSAQLVAVLMGAAGIVLMTFSDRVLLLWTGDLGLTENVSTLLQIVTLGSILNGLIWIPYHLQLAYGWTTLVIKVNVVAVSLLVPAIFFLAPIYGAIGAAWIWVALNIGYVLVVIHAMHRRLLLAEKWRWYGHDVALPLMVSAATALLCRWIIPAQTGKVRETTALLLVSGCVLLASVLAAPLVRLPVLSYLRVRIALLTRKQH